MVGRSNVVLVHGAGRGSWCWRAVQDGLTARGARVHAPTLTGLSDRAHLLSPQVGLGTHVTDVVALIEAHELDEVTLVGHSYGTMVLAGVLGRVPERLARVVLVDGPVALHGESGADVHPAGASFAARAVDQDGTLVLTSAFTPDPRLSAADNAWIARRVTPQPLACVTEPVELPGGWPTDLDKHYVRCESDPPVAPPPYLQRVRPDQGWTLHHITSHHDVMVAEPRRLTDLLADLCSLPTSAPVGHHTPEDTPC